MCSSDLVNFGANLKMITPSLNPDSLLPTFSGPVAALPMTTLTQLVDIFNPGAADTIRGYTMGKYAVDQSILSAFLPAHINRALNLMSTDDRNSQYASAYRKAVTYLEASGHGIPKRYDADGNFIYPEGFDSEAQEWKPGFESQREEWERQYAEAQSRFMAHKKQKEAAKAAEAAATPAE